MAGYDRTKIFYAAATMVFAGLLILFSYSRVFDEFEYSTLDLRYRVRPDRKSLDDIVIIEISDDSIDKIGKWPFPRNYHALLVNALASAKVKTIVFDVFFSEPKEEDVVFAEAVREAGNVYIAYVFDIFGEKKSPDYISAARFAAPLVDSLDESAAGTGFVNVEPDMDGKVRRVPAFIEYEGKFYPHLTLLAALRDMGSDLDRDKMVPGDRIETGTGRSIPLGEKSTILVDYPAEWGKAFRHYSYIDVIQSYLADVTGQEPIIDLTELEGTVCFIGLTATASPDAHPSPLEPLYPGIGVHTSVYDSIMRGRYLHRLGRWGNIAVLILMCVLTAVITRRSRKRFALFSIFIVVAAFIVSAFLVFLLLGLWIDLFYPLIAIGLVYVLFTFRKYIAETQKRELLEKELNIARDIQRSFLPQSVPEAEGMEISARMLTARQVGGDLYDFLSFDDGRVGVMIGDVSGKGVPAALYMAKAVSVFNTYSRLNSPSDALKNMNDRLSAESSSGLFVTVTYTIFDPRDKSFEYAIGGHLPTLLVEPDGKTTFLGADEGLPLGMIESDYSHVAGKYRPGSLFIMYTDGVTEAMDIKGEMFTQERLEKIGRSLKGCSAADAVAAVHKAVSDFAGRAKQHDDITVVAVRFV